MKFRIDQRALHGKSATTTEPGSVPSCFELPAARRLAKAPAVSIMFTGTFTAIVTPFRDGAVDEAALTRLVRAQLKGGVSGIVPVGTTGESPTLDYDEHIQVVELAVQVAAGKVPVIAGTGANSTREAVELTQRAEAVGADASLQVAPYYNKPTQEGLYQHFKTVAQNTRLPLMLYSIPGRCGIEIGVDTVARLAKDCPNIVSIKEAGGSCDRVSQLRAALPSRFSILSGDDSLTLPFLSVGATGVVSVASNIAPRAVSQMVRRFLDGDLRGAQRLHAKLYPLFKNLFVETNPTPVKAALALLGQMDDEVRLPLVPASPPARALVERTLKDLGLLK
jgi:4-hydroxy-tetrahydrodipicolinate synthase